MKSFPATLFFGSTAIFLCLFIVTPVSAETVVRAAGEVTVTADQSIAEDFYALGNTVTLSGTQEGDAYVVAGNTTLNGSVEADLVVIGGGVNVHGKVGDDVRVLAGEVIIGESIAGDLFVIAASLKILSTASIGGDVFFFGGEAEIAGEVSGGVMGSYTTLRIDSPVGQDVDVTVTDTLTLGENAAITGNVSYEAAAEMVRAPGASIGGDTIKSVPVLPEAELDTRVLAIQFLMSLFGSLCVYLALRRQLPALVVVSTTPLVARIGIGILGTVALLLLSIVLVVSVLGFWIGMFGLFASLALLVLGYLLTPIIVGAYLWQLWSNTPVVNTLSILIGAVAFHALLLVPLAGPVIAIALLMMAVGGLLTLAYRFLR